MQNVPKSLATMAQLRDPTGKLTNDAPQDPLLGPGRKKAKSGREKEGKVQESSWPLQLQLHVHKQEELKRKE